MSKIIRVSSFEDCRELELGANIATGKKKDGIMTSAICRKGSLLSTLIASSEAVFTLAKSLPLQLEWKAYAVVCAGSHDMQTSPSQKGTFCMLKVGIVE